LHWAIEHHEAETAQRMAGALQPFWFRRGHWSEGRRWLEESLAMDSGATQNQVFHAKALYEAGMLARFQGDFARARMLCEQSLASYRALDDKMGVLKALEQLSRISAFQEDQTARNAFLAEAASLIETIPDSIVKADAYTDMAIAMIGHRVMQALYPPEAARYLHESERIQRALNNPTGLALALMHLANHALFTGDHSRAASQLDEAERVVIELGDDRLLSRLAMIRVLVDLHERDFAAARRRMGEILQTQLAEIGVTLNLAQSPNVVEEFFLNMESMERRRPVIPPVMTDAAWRRLEVPTLFLVGEPAHYMQHAYSEPVVGLSLA